MLHYVAVPHILIISTDSGGIYSIAESTYMDREDYSLRAPGQTARPTSAHCISDSTLCVSRETEHTNPSVNIIFRS